MIFTSYGQPANNYGAEEIQPQGGVPPRRSPPPRCVGSSYFTLTMPNGRRRPYRLPFALEGTPSSPSPDHTSDSEETNHHKTKYRRLARTVISQWKDFTKRKLLRRTLALSGVRNFLANYTDDYLARTILAFVVQFQVKQQQVFENNPHKESRQRAIQYFLERTWQSTNSGYAESSESSNYNFN